MNILDQPDWTPGHWVSVSARKLLTRTGNRPLLLVATHREGQPFQEMAAPGEKWPLIARVESTEPTSIRIRLKGSDEDLMLASLDAVIVQFTEEMG